MNKFLWPVRVYYEDTDAGGVVFYANYLKFLERARTELLRSYGFEQDELRAEENVIFAVRSVHVDYLKPARFNDSLNVSAELSQSKKTSFYFTQEVMRGDEVLCRAEVRIACLAADSMRPKAIPAIIMEKLDE